MIAAGQYNNIFGYCPASVESHEGFEVTQLVVFGDNKELGAMIVSKVLRLCGQVG